MLPPVGVPGGDQSAAGGVGAFGGAAAGLFRELWQLAAATFVTISLSFSYAQHV